MVYQDEVWWLQKAGRAAAAAADAMRRGKFAESHCMELREVSRKLCEYPNLIDLGNYAWKCGAYSTDSDELADLARRCLRRALIMRKSSQ